MGDPLHGAGPWQVARLLLLYCKGDIQHYLYASYGHKPYLEYVEFGHTRLSEGWTSWRQSERGCRIRAPTRRVRFSLSHAKRDRRRSAGPCRLMPPRRRHSAASTTAGFQVLTTTRAPPISSTYQLPLAFSSRYMLY